MRTRALGAAVWVVCLIQGACGDDNPPARPSAGVTSTAQSTEVQEGAATGSMRHSPGPGQSTARAAAGGDRTLPLVRAPEMDGDVALIDVFEVREKLARGDPLVLIDTRKAFEFDLEHIPGAISIPLQKIAAAGELPKIPRNREIIVYCLAETCPSSRNAARVLARFGYTNVRDMRAGLMGWKQAGFETVRREKSVPRRGG